LARKLAKFHARPRASQFSHRSIWRSSTPYRAELETQYRFGPSPFSLPSSSSRSTSRSPSVSFVQHCRPPPPSQTAPSTFHLPSTTTGFPSTTNARGFPRARDPNPAASPSPPLWPRMRPGPAAPVANCPPPLVLPELEDTMEGRDDLSLRGFSMRCSMPAKGYRLPGLDAGDLSNRDGMENRVQFMFCCYHTSVVYCPVNLFHSNMKE
jgi:hypothetical protein